MSLPVKNSGKIHNQLRTYSCGYSLGFTPNSLIQRGKYNKRTINLYLDYYLSENSFNESVKILLNQHHQRSDTLFITATKSYKIHGIIIVYCIAQNYKTHELF